MKAKGIISLKVISDDLNIGKYFYAGEVGIFSGTALFPV